MGATSRNTQGAHTSICPSFAYQNCMLGKRGINSISPNKLTSLQNVFLMFQFFRQRGCKRIKALALFVINCNSEGGRTNFFHTNETSQVALIVSSSEHSKPAAISLHLSSQNGLLRYVKVDFTFCRKSCNFSPLTLETTVRAL